jgi:hypothetical protein
MAKSDWKKIKKKKNIINKIPEIKRKNSIRFLLKFSQRYNHFSFAWKIQNASTIAFLVFRNKWWGEFISPALTSADAEQTLGNFRHYSEYFHWYPKCFSDFSTRLNLEQKHHIFFDKKFSNQKYDKTNKRNFYIFNLHFSLNYPRNVKLLVKKYFLCSLILN